jgi:hypothetical protein
MLLIQYTQANYLFMDIPKAGLLFYQTLIAGDDSGISLSNISKNRTSSTVYFFNR